MQEPDTRNVVDAFKGKSEQEIIELLDKQGIKLQIAVENTLRDYNMGTIVRSANAFGVRTVHVIGRKQWNKRGAMKTDAYMHIIYHPTVQSFTDYAKQHGYTIICIDNTATSKSMHTAEIPANTIMVFGQEGPGISDELLAQGSATLHIPQLGSTRSLNVGVAAGIALYEWSRRHSM